ncbi:helix-turn-helix domain-containing protein, partial [Porphyromonas gingivalis]|uniref:helix-turn-helix domain-containing protein n=1 Tax=Porphyromonas gingivalis TaxID=837 RepID=UPI000B715E19
LLCEELLFPPSPYFSKVSFGEEIHLTGREVCERLFISPRTLQDYRDKSIIPYIQIAGKILYRHSDINRLLQENYVRQRTL